MNEEKCMEAKIWLMKKVWRPKCNQENMYRGPYQTKVWQEKRQRWGRGISLLLDAHPKCNQHCRILGVSQELHTPYKRSWTFGGLPVAKESCKKYCVSFCGGQAYMQNLLLHEKIQWLSPWIPFGLSPKE